MLLGPGLRRRGGSVLAPSLRGRGGRPASRRLLGHRAGRQLRGDPRAGRRRGRRAPRCSRPPRWRRCRAWSNGGGCRRRRRSTARSRTWDSRSAPRSPRACCSLGGAGDDPAGQRASTFALSAVVLARLRVRAAAPAQSGTAAGGSTAPRRRARRCRSRSRGFRASATVLASLGRSPSSSPGIFNVAELLFVEDESGTRRRRVLSCWSRCSASASSRARWLGRGRRCLPELKRRYLLGLLLIGRGLPGLRARAPVAIAAVAFVASRLRQRDGAGLRAAADPGHGSGRACRPRLRRQGRADRVGVRASRFSWPAGLIELHGRPSGDRLCRRGRAASPGLAAIVALRNVWTRGEAVPAAPLGGGAARARAGRC